MSWCPEGAAFIEQAVAAHQAGNLPAALTAYYEGIVRYENTLVPSSGAKIRQELTKLMAQYKLAVNILQKQISPPLVSTTVTTTDEKSPPSPAETGVMIPTADKELDAFVQSMRLDVSAHPVSWESIHGNHSVKEQLRSHMRCLWKGDDVDEKTAKVFGLKLFSAVLLYGPPGTGKTLLAKAVATSCPEAALFNVQASDVISKYHGESDRILKQVFREARRLAPRPVILFLDEMDGLLPAGSREKSSTTNSDTRIVQTFQQEMDGLASVNSNITVMGGTNYPWDLGPAIRRRMGAPFYVGLLTPTERREYIIQMCKESFYTLYTSNPSWDALVDATDRYTVADFINNLQPYTSNQFIRLKNASYFVCEMGRLLSLVPDVWPLLEPTPEQIASAMTIEEWKTQLPLETVVLRTTYQELKPHLKSIFAIKTPPVTLPALLQLFQRSPPTNTKEELERYQKWGTQVEYEGTGAS